MSVSSCYFQFFKCGIIRAVIGKLPPEAPGVELFHSLQIPCLEFDLVDMIVGHNAMVFREEVTLNLGVKSLQSTFL